MIRTEDNDSNTPLLFSSLLCSSLLLSFPLLFLPHNHVAGFGFAVGIGGLSSAYSFSSSTLATSSPGLYVQYVTYATRSLGLTMLHFALLSSIALFRFIYNRFFFKYLFLFLLFLLFLTTLNCFLIFNPYISSSLLLFINIICHIFFRDHGI